MLGISILNEIVFFSVDYIDSCSFGEEQFSFETNLKGFKKKFRFDYRVVLYLSVKSSKVKLHLS
jgi:hypothetical protein